MAVMGQTCRIELLGDLKVRHGKREMPRLARRKAASLLAYLAYHCGRAHTREALAEWLWKEAEPSKALNNLRPELSAIRSAFRAIDLPDELLLADRDAVRLDAARVVTDVAEFEDALKSAARAENEAGRVEALTRAIDLYRGPLLPGHFDDWILPERQHLAGRYLGALRQLVQTLVRTRDFDRALGYARRAVQADPLYEQSHRDLMRLLVAVGRPDAARDQYRELERVVRTQLGVPPSTATRELDRQIAAHLASAVAASVADTASPLGGDPKLSMLRAGIPLQFTRFFGREAEIEQVQGLLLHPDRRLVTLTGPGGCGKTRLAIELAASLRERFDDRVWFVPLADLTEAARLFESIHGVLGLPRSPGVEPFNQVVGMLSAQPATLVLDNLEQLAEASAPQIRLLLERVPTLTLLVTSRRPLHLTGEQEFAVPPLPTPTHRGTPERLLEFPSVQLFVDRARTRRPDFQLTSRNAADVAALCERLEGVPLAIELAAAWTKLLTPEQMLGRLESRFEFLVSSYTDLPARHRTLRAAWDGSYRLLSPPLQSFFARLSGFRGGWSLEAAATVCDEPKALESLQQLQDDSLIVAEETDEIASRILRYRMLESLREYAAEQLDEADAAALARRHADYFLYLAETAERELMGPHSPEWLEHLEIELDNLRAALAWAVKTDPVFGLRLACALVTFWEVRGHLSEGRAQFAALLETAPHAPTAERARALNGVGLFASLQGDYVVARTQLEESLALWRGLGRDRNIANVLNNLGNVDVAEGYYRQAQSRFAESLELSKTTGYQTGVAMSLNNLAMAASGQGDIDAARALYEQSLALERELGNVRGEAVSLLNLGALAQDQQDYEAATAYYEQGLATRRQLGDRYGIAMTLNNLGEIAIARRDFAEANRLVTESLILVRELGDRGGVLQSLEALAYASGLQQRYERSARLLGMAQALREVLGTPMPTDQQAEYDEFLTTVLAGLDPAAFTEIVAQGRALTLEQAVAYALEDRADVS